jgi:hypothetical protein
MNPSQLREWIARWWNKEPVVILATAVGAGLLAIFNADDMDLVSWESTLTVFGTAVGGRVMRNGFTGLFGRGKGGVFAPATAEQLKDRAEVAEAAAAKWKDLADVDKHP